MAQTRWPATPARRSSRSPSTAYEVNHKGTWLFTRGPVTVWVGPQVDTAGLDDDAIAVVMAEMRADIHEFVETGFPRELAAR